MTNLMTIDEVSELTRVPAGTLRYYRTHGALGPRSFKLGRRVVYKDSDVDSWVEAQCAKTGA
jgi:DNA-binding transcriptional MerR regulator